MTRISGDIARIACNFLLALGQIAISQAVFFRGFSTAPVPYPERSPTPIEPAGYAFAIWGPIYLGCLAYAAYQALPRNREAPLLRRVGWLTAAAFALCCAWLAAAAYGPVWITAPVIVAMLALLLIALRRTSMGALTREQWWLVQAPLALYGGWLTLAVCANAVEVLATYGLLLPPKTVEHWTITALALSAVLAYFGSAWAGKNLFYTGAVVWGLIAIVIANITRNLSPAVTLTAALAAMLLLASAIVSQFRSRGSYGSKPGLRSAG